VITISADFLFTHASYHIFLSQYSFFVRLKFPRNEVKALFFVVKKIIRIKIQLKFLIF